MLRASVGALAAVPAVALGAGIIIRKDLTIREVALKFAEFAERFAGFAAGAVERYPHERLLFGGRFGACGGCGEWFARRFDVCDGRFDYRPV